MNRFRRQLRDTTEGIDYVLFSKIQKLSLGVLLVGVVLVGAQVFQLATRPETTLRSITNADDATSNAFFTQRESLVLAFELAQWMSGEEFKRAVLIRRALLGQRLNVKDASGITNGERAHPEYLAALIEIDKCLASTRDGVLAKLDQVRIRAQCSDDVEVLVFESRQLGVDISGAGDVRVRDIARQDQAERSEQTLRLLALVVVLLAVGGFLGVSRARSLQRVRRDLENDREAMRLSQQALERIEAELETRVVADNMHRLEDQRLDAAVRALTAEVRKLTSTSTIAESLVRRIREVLKLDRAFVHIFADGSEPEVRFIIATNESSDPVLADLSEDHRYSREMIQLTQSAWQQEEIRPTLIRELKEQMSDRLVSMLSHLGMREDSSLVPIGEGQTVLGALLIHRNGEQDWSFPELSALQNAVSQAANAIGALRSTVLVRKVRENQQVVAELQHLDQMKDEFTANVNHELRTPLTSIIGYLELITSDADQFAPDTRGYLMTVKRNADRLLELIEKLLVISRPAGADFQSSETEIDLAEVVKDSVATSIEKNPDSSRAVEVSIAPGAYLMRGDRLRLEQIVHNLVGNSMKFSDNLSTIRVDLRQGAQQQGDHVWAELRISDTGIGIPADEIPQLFNRFYRATNAARALIPGTGLGLSIVQQFVELHNGSIDVTSELGKGTTVTVRLPLTTTISQ